MAETPPSPSLQSVLDSLAQARVIDVGRALGVRVEPAWTKAKQVEDVVRRGRLELAAVLRLLTRDELRVACRAHGVDDSGRARADLAERLLSAAAEGGTFVDTATPDARADSLPKKGDIVVARQRQYLVEDVVPSSDAHGTPWARPMTLVRLVCLDDDAQGRRLDVLWELELGARVVRPERHGLGDIDALDPPRYFAAYLHALKWSCVSATDARLFQAPFRAGIKLLQHQLAPLKKALELPRANLFITDDVGLGKTIEAGLVLQELLLRQRVDWILIVCPPAIALQWRGEMQRRFGLWFEIYDRTFVARRRQEFGFGVNPWATHTRFIISYQTLRRPEYRDPLLQHLGERARKSLLILDEAHTVAPASASKYAIDSRLTRVVRDVAPRFENRLFLSATPHNGHSNSFSALLEILDPQRFTRGVPVKNSAQLEPVMVRRLKGDLRELGVTDFPERRVLQYELRFEAGRWFQRVREDDEVSAPEPLHDDGAGAALGGSDIELRLAAWLAEYTKLMKPAKGRARLVFVNLQKRLLSSVDAFYRTLKKHADAVERRGEFARMEDEARTTASEAPQQLDIETYGARDEDTDAAEDHETFASSEGLEAVGRARELLELMLTEADAHRHLPSGKALALLRWIRQHQCRAAQVGGSRKAAPAERQWTDRRVIVFTEYGHTKNYLRQLLAAALDGTDRAEERVSFFHGGMSDDQREELQQAFNGDPAEYPVRILVATDAAREGVNLQGHCADLFHYDIPWNPARLEQRNGRIDRTLQSEPEVRCMYFTYPQRAEDLVLDTVFRKVDVIQRELGSIGAVVMDRIEEALADGIDEGTAARVEQAATDRPKEQVAKRELEAQRRAERLKSDYDESGKSLERSQKVLEFEPALLRDALNVGFELSGASELRPVELLGPNGTQLQAFALPELPDGWQRTVDTLRPPRRRVEPFWEWRKKAPQPVVFEPPPRLTTPVAHLHLEHPLVQRVLERFRSQGYAAHDLSRVTVVPDDQGHIVRVIVFGRLSLFGAGATRLHDQLVSVAAQRLDVPGPDQLRPFKDEADRKAIDRLERLLSRAPDLSRIGEDVRRRLRGSAPADFASLWPHIEAEADAQAHEAELKLAARGRAEAAALRSILEAQKHAIRDELQQLPLPFGDSEVEKAQRRQWDQNRRHMEDRLRAIDREIEKEPAQLEELYRTVLRRLEPVGLVYLWPATR